MVWYTDSSWCCLLSSWCKRGKHIYTCKSMSLKKINVCLACRQKGGRQRDPPVSAVSQLSSAQRNPAVRVACFGVAYSDPLQL